MSVSSSPGANGNSFHVVVLGGNFAGISISHHLLRNILPALSTSPEFSYKLSLLTPNTHAVWKPGVPQALINEKVKNVDDLFLSTQEAFSRYGDAFELVQGKAKSIDRESRKLFAEVHGSTALEELHYDALVITTGTTAASPLWTINGIHEDTKRAILDFRKSLEHCKTILIAGGGAAGVEAAGIIAYHLPEKDITLLSGTDRVLPRKVRPSISQDAESQLIKLGVKVEHHIRVQSATPITSTHTPATLLHLTNNTTRAVDLYLDATGAIPNTSFAPKSWLTPTSYINTCERTLRVLSSPSSDHGIYCSGDVASWSQHSVPESQDPTLALGYSLFQDFHQPPPDSDSTHKRNKNNIKPIEYRPNRKDFLVVPIGGGGVGVLHGWRIPSFAVWLGKGRNFLQGLFRGIVWGDKY
ncbi:putative apoptosis-inducing factor 1 [Phaeomoniella chlamydospora]|uniref:Putative apoptosis-inducing factor 1 n=1 Tax=Phaeomoniella chlamydospora TaxID=158046 RepID=A0A0G2GD94_PHACM|nr:putative apoptosis-inducing factor 1 [Phaeomoniella chlamydospora]